MPSLRKGDQNQHGGYAYVSIDDYYEKAAKVVVDHGLTWKIRETDSDMIEVQGRQRLENAVRTTYEVDLMHESGEWMQGFFKATITHPLQGAQTAGSSMSYLDKLFLRTTFHIVTGEKDADATDNAVFTAGPADAGRGSSRKAGSSKSAGQGAAQDPFAGLGEPTPEPAAAEPSADAAAFFVMASQFVKLAKTNSELTKYWNDNEKAFLSLQAEAPESYKTLIAAFKARKDELTQPKGSEG